MYFFLYISNCIYKILMFHQTYSSDITLVLSLITEWIILILFTYFYLVYVVEVVDIPGFGEEFIADYE